MRFVIKGVGILPDIDLEVEGLTIIAGMNGTGKSTVLKTVYSILEASNDIMGKRDAEVVQTLAPLLRRYVVGIPGIVRFDSGLIPDYIGSLDKVQHMSDSDREAYARARSLYADGVTDEFHRRVLESTVVAEFGGSDQFRRLGSDAEACVEIHHNGSVRSLGVSAEGVRWDGAYMDLPGAVYYDTPFILDGTPLSDGQYNHRAQMSRMVRTVRNPGIIGDMVSDSRLEELDGCISKVAPGRIVPDPARGPAALGYVINGNDPLDVRNLAAGMKVFSIIRTLVNNGHIDRDTLILLDEPEIHLHPQWQLVLGELLVLLTGRMGCRILMTTHSPVLLRSIQANSRIHSVGTHYYCLEHDEAGDVAFRDLRQNPEQAYVSMSDAFDQAENLYYGADLIDMDH